MKSQNIVNPEEFIKTIRESFYGSVIVYTSGSCSKLFNILKCMYPNAELYSNVDHCLIKIEDSFYDIRGKYEKDIKSYSKVESYDKIEHRFDIFSLRLPTSRRYVNDILIAREELLSKVSIDLELISESCNISLLIVESLIKYSVGLPDEIINTIEKEYGLNIQDEAYKILGNDLIA